MIDAIDPTLIQHAIAIAVFLFLFLVILVTIADRETKFHIKIAGAIMSAFLLVLMTVSW